MKARYHVDVRGLTSWTNHALRWQRIYEARSRLDAYREARGLASWVCERVGCDRQWFPHKYGEPIYSAGVRIRYRGRVIARWKNGKRVTR